MDDSKQDKKHAAVGALMGGMNGYNQVWSQIHSLITVASFFTTCD